MPTAKTDAIAKHCVTKTRHLCNRLTVKWSSVAARVMSIVAGMWADNLIIRAVVLCALIVASYAAKVVHPLRAESVKPDLSGRWTSATGNYVLDITRCGDDWCGVKLKTDQSCGALALRLAARPDATDPHRLGGTLNLDPAVQLYQVTATVTPRDAARPSELRLSGTPDTSGLPTRVIPFSDRLVRGPDATCRRDSKVS